MSLLITLHCIEFKAYTCQPSNNIWATGTLTSSPTVSFPTHISYLSPSEKHENPQSHAPYYLVPYLLLFPVTVRSFFLLCFLALQHKFLLKLWINWSPPGNFSKPLLLRKDTFILSSMFLSVFLYFDYSIYYTIFGSSYVPVSWTRVIIYLFIYYMCACICIVYYILFDHRPWDDRDLNSWWE